MNLRNVSFGLSAMVLGVVLVGCIPHVEQGFVNVEVRSVDASAPGGIYTVTITGPDGEEIETSRLGEGSSLTLGSVPFGWVKIEADSRCSVESELNADRPSMGLVIDGVNCTLTD